MLHAVLMAGGSGTRFWPASRRRQPKQLLAFSGSTTMIQATANRLGDAVTPQRRWVITNRALVDQITAQLPDVRVVGEPCRRDTAPCIGLAAALILAEDPQATMLVMPSDHVIRDEAAFRGAVARGQQLVERDPRRLVTFGIPPAYPAESFGYIQRGEPLEQFNGGYHVSRFREKPDAATARGYLDSGRYYWNSGIFLWRADTILELLRRYEPAMAATIDHIARAAGSPDFANVLDAQFAQLNAKSIDYAVMERHDRVAVIEAPFDWDDVGSWQAIARLQPQDELGNTSGPLHVGVDTRGTIVHQTTADHLIVTIDLEEMIVVHTPDATLVAPKRSEQRVREAVQAIEARQLDTYL